MQLTHYNSMTRGASGDYFDVKIVSEHIPLHRETISSTLKLLKQTEMTVSKCLKNRIIWFHILGYSGISIRYGNGTKSLVGVLGVLGPPNFAGILLGSIPNDSDLFWGNPTSFRKNFIFVHFVHSMTRGASGDYFDVKIVSKHIPLHRETISSTLKLL